MKKILLSLIPAGAVAGIVLSGLPANAATTSAATTGITCNGNLCATVIQLSGETATIEAWASDYSFYGYFEVATQRGFVGDSPTQLWSPSGGFAGKVGVSAREETEVTVTEVSTGDLQSGAPVTPTQVTLKILGQD